MCRRHPRSRVRAFVVVGHFVAIEVFRIAIGKVSIVAVSIGVAVVFAVLGVLIVLWTYTRKRNGAIFHRKDTFCHKRGSYDIREQYHRTYILTAAIVWLVS